jgi:hypothetical protein
MTKHDGLPMLVTGIGIGVAATLLMLNRKTWKRGEKAMSDVKDKLKNKIDDAADAGKKVVEKVVDKSKDAAHKAGEQLERGGKRLQNA